MEDIAHLFTQPEEFPQPAGSSPFRVFNGEIQQLEHSRKGILEAIIIVPFEGSGRTLKLASDIPQLFGD